MEFEGATEREAVDKACSALRLGTDDLDYTVIDEGSGGLFGLGSRPVRIRTRTTSNDAAQTSRRHIVERESEDRNEPVGQPEGEDEEARGGIVGPAPEKAAKALEVAQGFAEKMGMDAEISVRDENERIVIVIDEKPGSTA